MISNLVSFAGKLKSTQDYLMDAILNLYTRFGAIYMIIGAYVIYSVATYAFSIKFA